MPVQPLEDWAGSRKQTFALSALRSAVIGVDASYYLDLRLNKSGKDALLPALGGFSYVLKGLVEQDVKTLKSLDISPVFIFNGLDFRNKRETFASSAANRRFHDNAWQFYEAKDQDMVRAEFQKARYPVELLSLCLQSMLDNLDVQYLVAPYSSVAQLSYMESQPVHVIDTIWASGDAFLFGVDKIITDIEYKTDTQTNDEAASFTWLSRAVCQESMGKMSNEVFRDAQLLLGSPYLPTFPTLERGSPNKQVTLRESLNLLNTANRSIIQLCQQLREDSQVQRLDYADRYKKALMTLKHHVVLETNGKVAPMYIESAPGDVHEFVGQRLPDELYFYISRGLIGPTVPNWLTSEEITLSLPGGCAESEAYRRLMRDQLDSLRRQSICLLSNCLNRYFLAKNIRLKLWFDGDTSDRTISVRETASIRDQIRGWKVHEGDFPAGSVKSQKELPLRGALAALGNAAFVEKSRAKPSSSPLKTTDEIIYNVVWRLLQLRGFSDEKHELTNWGKALEAAVKASGTTDTFQDPIFITIELLRLGLVNGKVLSSVQGGATQGSDQVKTAINLVSHVACVGRLRHSKEYSYSGPLDRQLLSYHYMINAVRSSLRDLVETIMVSMFLSGEIDRDRNDWSDLALHLPFTNDNGCGLGIASLTYLNELTRKGGDAPSASLKSKIKNQEQKKLRPDGDDYEYNYKLFAHVSNMPKNLEDAFKIWDAVYAGVQVAGKEVKDAKAFADADEWLKARR